jgi:hypothetical protein
MRACALDPRERVIAANRGCPTVRRPRPSPSVCPASNAGLARRARERPSHQAVRHASISTTGTCCAPAWMRRPTPRATPTSPGGTSSIPTAPWRAPPWIAPSPALVSRKKRCTPPSVIMQRAPPSAPGGAPVPPMHSWWWTSASGAQRRCAPDARPGMRAPCAPRTHVVQSCCPSLSAVRTPEPRMGFPGLREGFSPTARAHTGFIAHSPSARRLRMRAGTPAHPGRSGRAYGL